jgi:hypothetical protein
MSINSPEKRTQSNLQTLIDDADQNLQNLDSTPFSEPAFDRLKYKISEYIVQLITESIKTSKRRQADNVSTSHVELASQYLVSSTSHKVFKHLGTLGGIFLGAGISNLLSMVTTSQYNITGIAISVILTGVGAFLVAFHIARD